MTAHTWWLLRSQNRSRMAIGMRHGHFSVFQRAKSNQMPPNSTGNNQTGPSTLSENIIMMPTKLLSIQPIFRGLNSGDSNLILHTIRHNPERDKKLSMAHTKRPRTLRETRARSHQISWRSGAVAFFSARCARTI